MVVGVRQHAVLQKSGSESLLCRNLRRRNAGRNAVRLVRPKEGFSGLPRSGHRDLVRHLLHRQPIHLALPQVLQRSGRDGMQFGHNCIWSE
jgi:hypothetical protein